MKRLRSAGLIALGVVMLFALGPTSEATAADTNTTIQKQGNVMLRTIAPGKGRLVTDPKLKLKASGPQGVTCCTHWNTSTGGTGCATYPDSCPDNTFTVDCGADGCW